MILQCVFHFYTAVVSSRDLLKDFSVIMSSPPDKSGEL